MHQRWQLLPIERRNSIAIATLLVICLLAFLLWQWWQKATALFVPLWEQRQGDYIGEIALSSDGRFLAAMGWRKREIKAIIYLFRVDNGQLVRAFTDVGRIETFALSPDGQKLAVGAFIDAGGEVRLLRSTDGHLLWLRKGHARRISGVAFSPDGRWVASASDDDTVCLWRTTDGTLQQVLKPPLKPSSHFFPRTTGVAFSPDGRLLAVGGEIISLWQVSNGQLVKKLQPSIPVQFLAFSPDEQWLASSDWLGNIKLWRVPDGQIIWSVQGHRWHGFDSPSFVAFSPDGQWLVSGGWDGTVKLWRVANGQLVGENKFGRRVNWKAIWKALKELIRPRLNVRVLWVRPNRVRGVAFLPDGKTIAVAYEPNKVRLFRLRLK